MTDIAKTDTAQRSSKPAIGVLIDSVDSYFNKRTIHDLMDAAEEQQLHLVFYFGGFLDKGKTAGPYSYAYTLPDPEEIRALIVLPDSIAPWSPKSSIALALEQFPGIPVYSLFSDMPECCSVFVEETNAIQAAIAHLTADHTYKRFAFVMGPDSQESLSRKRLNCIKRLLEKANIGIDPANVFPGTFRIEDGAKAARSIMMRGENAPDILICMNDQMAIGAVKEFLNTGISVPEDIAVIGFDDVEENAILHCSLTSINYPIWEMANILAERIASDISGATVYANDKIPIKAQFMHRESCGCTSWFEKNAEQNDAFIPLEVSRSSQGTLKRAAILRRTLEDVIDDCIAKNDVSLFTNFTNEAITTLSRSGDLTNSFIDMFSTQWTVSLLKHQDFNSQILVNSLFIDAFRMLMQTKTKIFSRIHNNDVGTLEFYQNCNALIGQKLTVYNSLKAINSNLPQLGIDRCLIVFINPDDPETGEIRINFTAGHPSDIPESDFERIPIKKLTENGLSSIRETIGVLTIAHENYVYGYIVLSVEEKHFEQFSMIQKLISQIIDTAMTNEILSTHIQTLTKKNDLLSRLSVVDEFTGLCNRRALYVTGRNMYQKAVDEMATCCFIFLDMDSLKKINDTYGHTEGDKAILAFSNILKKCFREGDLVVRYGGDEFVVLMTNIQEEILHKALARITETIEAFNGKKIHEWSLSVSWGFVFNDSRTTYKTFESIIEESDAHLYQEKRRKKGLTTE